jgi:hypothetical protein
MKSATKTQADISPPKQKTKPEVFIIESLDWDDEDGNDLEGRILSDMLRLAGKSPRYVYFRSKSELPHVIALFRESQYRYLHLSCHGSRRTVGTTTGSLKYQEFAACLRGHMAGRRLFCSACLLGNESFVRAITDSNPEILSILAPACKVDIHQAAALWTAFYVSVFDVKSSKMEPDTIRAHCESLAFLFHPVKFRFECRKKSGKWGHTMIPSSKKN